MPAWDEEIKTEEIVQPVESVVSEEPIEEVQELEAEDEPKKKKKFFKR
jgi:hypothetical protein